METQEKPFTKMRFVFFTTVSSATDCWIWQHE